MLASLLRLETLLKCDLWNCIYDRLGETRQCPTCHMPAIVKNLRKDPMHDTLIACVKKLKQCLIESNPTSLSVPSYDPIKVGSNSQSHFQSPASQQHQQRTTELLLEYSQNVEHELENDTGCPQQFQQLRRTYDSDATTQSSQRLVTTADDINQTIDNNERPAPLPRSKLLPTHSTDDLLLAMEDEEVNEDELSYSDTPASSAFTTTVINSETDTTIPLPTICKQQNRIYSSSDDLLAAMELEEMLMDDDDDDGDNAFDSARSSLANKTSCGQSMPLSRSNRRRLSNNTCAGEEVSEPTNKHQKTELTTNSSNFAVPLLPMTNENNQSTLWKCTTCLFGGNEANQLICNICRKERTEDVPMANDMTPTFPATLDLSITSRSIVPSTITTEILQQQRQEQQLQQLGGSNQNIAVRVMCTSLTENDNAKLDSAMSMAIDSSLKMEIYSDVRDLDNVTHLITSVNEQGLCTRTIKYLLSIITGKWIVSTSWMIESIQVGYWLPEENYQIVGDKTSGITNGPERGRRQRQGMDDGDPIRFFGKDDIRFFFYGDFSDHDTKVKLLQLVRKGGGKIISRRPPLDQLHQDGLIIIVPSLEEMRCSRKKAHAWLDKCAHVKDSQWLLDSIARSNWVLE
ncbi:hypothetical protein BCR42DRAFT_17168 [Absidia repens]|uniref:BRCT domain-containing protein n=1 Tax=Absidia repens TaxID=90262 RepID=A0A1X2J3W4_9FUNG|nr:hypothetical protein BCR42DRAFT_17168 [Absidia repens]